MHLKLAICVVWSSSLDLSIDVVFHRSDGWGIFWWYNHSKNQPGLILGAGILSRLRPIFDPLCSLCVGFWSIWGAGRDGRINHTCSISLIRRDQLSAFCSRPWIFQDYYHTIYTIPTRVTSWGLHLCFFSSGLKAHGSTGSIQIPEDLIYVRAQRAPPLVSGQITLAGRLWGGYWTDTMSWRLRNCDNALSKPPPTHSTTVYKLVKSAKKYSKKD